MSATLRFLPWLRRGLARNLTERAVQGLPKSAARLDVKLEIAGTTVEKSVRLRGPGDVIGLAEGQVVRRFPADGAKRAEPNLFAAVEVATPDLPWLFTPAAPDKKGRLVPWIALVVVQNQDGVTLSTRTEAAPAALKISAPADAKHELPDPRDAWAWAHVQTSADTSGGLDEALESSPEAFVARLLCPRRLEADRDYYACVVPLFRAGAQAGLGLDADPDDVALAWSVDSSSVELPVYVWWSFRTGPEGDFESLVRRLTPRVLPSDFGLHALDVGDPGEGLPSASDAEVDYAGALLAADAAPATLTNPYRRQLRSALRTMINEQLTAPAADASPYDALTDDPLVGPPAYGALPAGADAIPEPGAEPVWLADLNLDPVARGAAGVGARVVRRFQETLMAEAWDQARGLRLVNRTLARARLAVEVGTRLKQRVDALGDGQLLQCSRGAQARLKSGGRTVSARVASSALPEGLISSAFRRITRLGGAVTRALGSTGDLGAKITDAFLARPTKMLEYAAFVVPSGLSLQDDALIADLTSLSTSGTVSSSSRTTARSSRARRRTTARASTARTATPTFAPGAAIEAPVMVRPTPIAIFGETDDLSSLAGVVRATLDPTATNAARLRARVTAPESAWGTASVPAIMLPELTFDESGAKLLCTLDVEWLAPGAGEIEDDTVALAVTNGAFVEAFLAGVNHELARELVWRELPVAADGTWLRRFWDRDDGADDIPPLDEWTPTALGTHLVAEATPLVLLIKGELPRRYPNAEIYAVPATWSSGARVEDPAGEAVKPLFRTRIDDGLWLFGFALEASAARGSRVESEGNAGWFFVLEEHPSEPRFGLDVASDDAAGTTPSYWRDLNWGHLADDAAGVAEVRFASSDGRLDGMLLPYDTDSFDETWGSDAVAMARITFQRPARVLIHADSMLPEVTT